MTWPHPRWVHLPPLIGLCDFFTWCALHQVYTRFAAIPCSSVNSLCPPEHKTEYSLAWFGCDLPAPRRRSEGIPPRLPGQPASSLKKLTQSSITNPTTTNCQIGMAWQTHGPLALSLFGSRHFKQNKCVHVPLTKACVCGHELWPFHFKDVKKPNEVNIFIFHTRNREKSSYKQLCLVCFFILLIIL